MKLKISLSALLIAAASQAASDEIKVRVIAKYDSDEIPIVSRVRLITSGQESGVFSIVRDGAKVHVFKLDTCPDGAHFHVEIVDLFFEPVEQTDEYDCEHPEVIVLAKLGNASTSTWYANIAGSTDNPSAPGYAARVAATLVTPTDSLSALGPQATRNHTAMIAAISAGDLGTASFFANENAALARNAGSNTLAVGYATASYDFGFRAMGIDPVTPANPLVALDATQNNIPVLTTEGQTILRRFNSTIGTFDTNSWSNQTTSALREIDQIEMDTEVMQLNGSAAIQN